MSFTYTKKISILVLIVVIICLSLILVPGVTFASDSAVKNAFEDIEYAANTKSEYISLYLEELEHTTTSLSESIWLTNYFDDQHNITIDYLNQELENIHQNHPEFEDIEIFDKYGIVMASSNQSMIGLNKRKSTEFHDGMINITFHDIIQRNITGAYVFPISKMIIENNQIKGLVMIYVNPQYLFYYLSQNRILSETEETFLVNRNGLLLSPTNSANDTIYATIIDTKNIQRALQNQESSFYEMNLHSNNILSFDNHRGEKVFGTYRTIPHTSWILLTEQNYDATLNQVFYIIQLYFGIAFLLICIGLLIAFYTSRRLTKPILELRDATKKIGDGFLDTQISISNRDEVGDLADSFRFMTKSLKQSRNEIQRYSEKLENLVDERTQELRQSEKKLKLYVEKLERNKIALTNIMMDMKRTMQAREIAEQDLKKSHAMLQELNEELEHKVKQRTEDIEKLLKQKDEFIHQLGHDLKNPLGPLINLLPILENKVHEDEDKEIITVLKRNVDYMKNLVKNTLELARLNSPKTKLNMESFNLKDELNDIIDNNHFLFKEKNMQVENKVSDVLMVHADKLRLEELLTNLLNNAVKYSDQNGNIWISAEEQNEFIQLSIQDDGIGMTTDQIERLFDEFYKADESRHDFDSSGLGMSIAKRIVEKHGGRIWVESKGLGMGSTFHFTLPRKDVEYG